MATNKKTAGETAKKEPKVVAPKAETQNQEAPKVEVKKTAVPKEIADQLKRQRLDIVMLVATMRAIIGMCHDKEFVKVLTDNGEVYIKMASSIAQLMTKRYDINSLETLGMSAFIASEIAPMAFEAAHKVDDEAKKEKATTKKEGVK